MLRSAAVAVAVVVLSTPFVRWRDAEACSFPPPVLLEEDLDAGLTGVPTSGLVSLYAQINLDELDGQVVMTVLDPDGVEVTGSLRFLPSRLLWQADTALRPEATYDVTLVVPWDAVEFAFTTGTDDTTPPLDLALSDQSLSEVSVAEDLICCDPTVNSCGTEEFEHCWVQSATYLPHLQAVFGVDVEAGRYYEFELEAPDALRSYSVVGSRHGNSLSVVYGERRETHCATVRARSLIDGAEVEREVCRPLASLVPLPAFVPQSPDYELCEDAPVDPETNEEIDITDNGGCAVGSRGSRLGGLLVLCAVGLLVLRVRWS